MTMRRFWASVALCLVVIVACFMYAGPVFALPKPTTEGGGDKSYMEQKGIEGLLSAGSGKDDPRAPKGWQKALGLGSIAVMVIVVKYL